MRKVKLQMQTSVDGFVAGSNGEMDWMEWSWDEYLIKYVQDFTRPIDTIMLGRKLAEGFIPTWAARAGDPESADAFTHQINNSAKVVFTKMLDTHEWENTTLAKGALADEIRQLKQQPGGDIVVYGGGNFVSGLIKENLIDEYHLFINPTVLGDGMPIFESLESKLKLKLINAIPTPCGIVVLHYEPVRQGSV